MPLLSDYARARKLRFLLERVRPGHRVLEVGAGDGWLGRGLARGGVPGCQTLDLKAPADFVGDVRDWRRLGVPEASFDWVVALEVVEHVPCFDELYALLKPGGLLFATSPAPGWDWLCAVLERLGLSQRRTSPHAHLADFREIPRFEAVLVQRFGLLSQWGLFRKPARDG